MKKYDPEVLDTRGFYSLMTEAVAPRPIAFASTVDENGAVNLSPFSFFNVFSSKPPILVFSPVRRGRDGTAKDTLNNVSKTKEVVINIVNHQLVEQMSLASAEYSSDVNEFVKSGLTPIESEKVKPPRVKEAPVQFECKVNEIISFGENGGAGNLVVCQVVLAHVNEELLDNEGHIDPQKIDLVARMGQDYYCRAYGAAVFEVEKPIGKICIGVDNIPDSIRNSNILTGNNLGQLGNVEQLPETSEVEAIKEGILSMFSFDSSDKEALRNSLHEYAKDLLGKGEVYEAWKVLLINA